MKFKIVSDIKQAEKLWKTFSPNRYFWDLWDVRQCFIEGANYPVHFIVSYTNEEISGILPLWHDLRDNSYYFIGGEFPENNQFFIKDKRQIPLFLKQCPPKTYLYYLQPDDKDFFNGTTDDLEKYFLNPPDYSNLDNFIKTFSKKHRNNLKHDLRIIQENGYTAIINNYPSNIISLIKDYNIERFGEESFFGDAGFVKSMEKLLTFAKKNGLEQVITIEKNGQTVGAVLAVYYNKIYTMIIGGSNPKINNLGKLLMFKHFENAFSLQAQTIDLMSGGGWKDLWHLPHYPAYEWHN